MTTQKGDLILTRDEIVTMIEREAQSRYGIDAYEFARRVRNGTFDECGDAADLIGLARLLGAEDKAGIAA